MLASDFLDADDESGSPSAADFLADIGEPPVPPPAAAAPAPAPGLLDRFRSLFVNEVGATPDAGDPMGSGAAQIEAVAAPPAPTLAERLQQPQPDYNPQTDAEWLSKAPATQQRILDKASRKAPPVLRAMPEDERIVSDVARASDNPVYRGAAAGFGQLAKTGIGAARFVADVLGADEAAGFLGSSSRLADNMSGEATRGLVGNEKLIADVVASIEGSAPALVLGVAGQGARAGELAMRTLWAQTSLAEYNDGRDAGFGIGDSAMRAGIMGAAEVLGERFDFAPQVATLRKLIAGKSADEVAALAAETITKNLAGEQVTTLIQTVADKVGPAALNPNATLADYLKSAGETFKLSLAQSGVMAGGPAVIAKVRDVGQRAELRDTQGADALDRLDAMRAAAAGAPVTPANPAAADYEALARGKGFLAPMPAVRAEDMPARPFTPEEVQTLKAAAPIAPPAPEPILESQSRAPAAPPTPAPAAPLPSAPPPAGPGNQALGIAAVPQGQLATRAEEELRRQAVENDTDAGTAPAAPLAPAVSSGDGQASDFTGRADGRAVGAAPAAVGRAASGGAPIGDANLAAPGARQPGAGAGADSGGSAAPAYRARRAVVATPQRRTAALRSLNVAAQAEALAAGATPPRFEAVNESQLDGEQLDLTRELAGWLGRPVIVTRAVQGESIGDGVFVNGAVLIDEGTREAPIAVVMHEAGIHGLDRDLKLRVIEAVRPTLQNRDLFKRNYGYSESDGIDEEMTAVLATNEAKKPQFWRALRDKLGDDDFSQLVGRVMDSLDRFLQGFLPDESHRWTSNIRAVRAALVDAQAEQMRRVRDRAPPAPAPAPADPRRTREPQLSRRQSRGPDDYTEDAFSVDRLMSDDADDYSDELPSLDEEVSIPTGEAFELSDEEMAAQDDEADALAQKEEELQAELRGEQAPRAPRSSRPPPDLIAELLGDGESVAGYGSAAGLPHGGYGPERPAADFNAVTDARIAAEGIMAEQAYPELTFTQGEEGDRVAVVRIGDRDYGDVALGGEDAWYGVSVDRDAFVAARDGGEVRGFPANGPRDLSEHGRKQWAKRMMAAADLMGRGFDLYTAVPKAARKRVADLWKRVAALPGAAEFRRPSSVAKELREKGHAAVVQRLADEMFKGSRYKVRAAVAEQYSGDTSVEIQIDDGRGVQTGWIEYEARAGKSPRLVMHTQQLTRGSSAGKPFYQLAFNFADLLDYEVVADGSLLGVNNYRRTEQQMSAAARSGKASNVKPGAGQRVYGFNERARTPEHSERNLVRLALANARNAAEIVPEIESWRYDIKADRFTDTRGRDVSERVRQALARNDARALSFSRSTLARAALTFEAIEGEVAQLDGLGAVTQPVLYSRRQRADDMPLSDRLAGRAVAVPVHVRETGATAELRLDGGAYLARLERRRENLRRLAGCLG